MPGSRRQRVTIQDVAKAAEVSTSSVSNYLNGRLNHLRLETRERIRHSIAALDYSPSTVARQLKTGHTPMLGLLMPSVVSPYHGELALALDEAAQRCGFRPVLGNGHRDAGREKAFIDELVSYGVRGIIVTSELRNPLVMLEYVRRGVAFVLFDLRSSELKIDGVDVVTIDNALATSMAVDHLVALGHRAIAYVTPPPLSASRIARMHGYAGALERHGLGAPMIIQQDSDLAAEQGGDSKLAYFGQRVAAQLLQFERRPTAVVAMNNILAIGLVAGLHKLGLSVPGDMSLVGIDDIQLAGLMVPTLTTLRSDYTRMADNAIECLRSRLATPGMARRESVYAPELIVRESSAAPKPLLLDAQ